MKNTGYLLLLLVLILQSGGMMLIFNMQQCCVRYEMSEKLKGNAAPFEKLTLTVSEYQQSLVEKNEILLNGKMYDIKSVLVKGDMVELLAIHDKEEDEILEKIKRYFANTDLAVRKLPGHLQQLITMVYLPPSAAFPLLVISTGDCIFHPLTVAIVSAGSKIPSPPPKEV